MSWKIVRLSPLALAAALLAGCTSLPLNETVIVAAMPTQEEDAGDELSEIMRADLVRATQRITERDLILAPKISATPPANPATVIPRDVTQFFTTITALPLPVARVSASDLQNNWGDPRDGGKRSHRGLDIFAPRGTEVLSVTDGIISFKGRQRKGGLCIWVVDQDSGYSFYYAHLDAFADVKEGQAVRRGDILGYVGNTGNARRSSPHLHFSVLRNDEAINPYPLLTREVVAETPAVLSGGFGGGADR